MSVCKSSTKTHSPQTYQQKKRTISIILIMRCYFKYGVGDPVTNEQVFIDTESMEKWNRKHLMKMQQGEKFKKITFLDPPEQYDLLYYNEAPPEVRKSLIDKYAQTYFEDQFKRDHTLRIENMFIQFITISIKCIAVCLLSCNQ